MISAITKSPNTTFGAKIYTTSNKINKSAELCAIYLKDEDGAMSINSNFQTMAKGDSDLKQNYRRLEYLSPDGYTDRMLLRVDFRAPKEETAQNLYKAYKIFQAREKNVQDLYSYAANHYAELNKVNEKILATQKKLEKLEAQQNYLKTHLYSKEFEKTIDKYQNKLNIDTNRLAKEAGIDIYTKAGDIGTHIKEECQDGYCHLTPYSDTLFGYDCFDANDTPIRKKVRHF